MDVRQCVEGFIKAHEGGLSLDPQDSGNWFDEKGRDPVLVGSKYGVTGAALAQWRKVQRITAGDIAGLTLAEAVDIGVALYYERPDLDLLPWNPVTASILDMAWGAGPGQAIKLMQRMVGANADGVIGPRTAAAYRGWLSAQGMDHAARVWAATRNAFYDRIILVRPASDKYLRGWRNRTASFMPGTPWWRGWSGPAQPLARSEVFA